MKTSALVSVSAFTATMFATGIAVSLAATDRVTDCTSARGSDRAVSLCTTIIEADRLGGITVSAVELSNAYARRGLAYSKTGRYAAAIADYDMAIEINPNHVDAHYNRGRTHYRQRKYDLAVRDFTAAIARDPKRHDAYNSRGLALRKLKQLDRAVEDFSHAIALKPNYAIGYANRALTRQELGRGADALADINKALEFRPKDARAYSLRGEIHEALGQFESAEADYRKSLALQPSHRPSKKALVRLASRAGAQVVTGATTDDGATSSAAVSCATAVTGGGAGTQPPAGIPNTTAGQVTFVPGTTVGLVPPKGFEADANFAGFSHAGRCLILGVLEMPAKSFAHFNPKSMKQGFERRGGKVESVTAFPAGGIDGYLVKSTRDLRGAKHKEWMLILGGKGATAVVTMQAPIGDALSDEEVARTFETIRFRDPPTLEEQVDALPYTFGDLTGFKIQRTIIGNMTMLSPSPERSVGKSRKPLILVMQIKCSTPADASAEEFARELLGQMKDFKLKKVHRTEKTSVAGGTGYEVMASGYDTSSRRPKVIGLWFRYEAGNLLGVVAVLTPRQREALRAGLKSLAAGLRPKS